MPNSRTGAQRTRPCDLLFVLRPALMVPLWLFYTLGARLSSHEGWRFEVVLLPSAREWLGLLAMTAILGGGYLLNQMVDVETDRLNDKLFFLPRGIISMRTAGVELAVVWVLGLSVAWTLGLEFLRVALAAVAVSLTYSAEPVRAKARAGLDVLWNAIGFGLLAALGGAAATGALPGGDALWSVGSYAAAVAGVTASTVVLDREGDERAGLRTTAVALGETRTSLIGVLLLAAALGLALVARAPAAGVAALAALGLALVAHVRGDRAARVRSIQLGVGAFALSASFYSPYLLVLAVLVTLASRAYYRRRFGFVYPGPEPR